jgi:hypothetical protein
MERDASIQASIYAQVGRLISGIFQQQPYFVNTIEWRKFSDNYSAYFINPG